MKADYPLSLTNSVDNELQNSKNHGDETFIIPPDLFRITKPFNYPLKYPTVNSVKLKQNIFSRNFANFLLMISEL